MGVANVVHGRAQPMVSVMATDEGMRRESPTAGDAGDNWATCPHGVLV